ncbi:MAG: efflux RND transporter periplasmic adaptor subunit, partial [Chloroflexota bacterium]
ALAAAKQPNSSSDITQQQAAVTSAKAALAAAKQPNTAADIAQQEQAVQSAQAALAAAKQPNSSSDIAQQEQAVQSAQAALAAAKQPNTVADIQAARDTVVASTEALQTAEHPGTAQDIQQARDAVASAQAALSLAQQPNSSADIVQQQEAVTAAQAALDGVEHPNTPQDIAVSQAAVTQARQQLAGDQAEIAYETEIRAPSAGIIQAVNVVPGQLTSSLTSGTTGTAAVEMESAKGLEVTADVSEADIGSVRVGDPVAMTFNAYPNQTFVGLVSSLPLQATTTSSVTTYPVTISFAGSTQGLTPGMTATLTIVTAEVQNAIRVPNQAVTTTPIGSYVQTLDAHNTLQRVQVQIGLSDTSYTQVVSGLAVGDRIIVPKTSGVAAAAGGGFGGGRGGFGGGGG